MELREVLEVQAATVELREVLEAQAATAGMQVLLPAKKAYSCAQRVISLQQYCYFCLSLSEFRLQDRFCLLFVWLC